nr:hypothetical protein [Mesorhizobium sp.]
MPLDFNHALRAARTLQPALGLGPSVRGLSQQERLGPIFSAVDRYGADCQALRDMGAGAGRIPDIVGYGTNRKEIAMLSNSHEFVRPTDEIERAYLESLVRADYDRSHPGETFEDMKRRRSFSKEDNGLYRDWMAIAAARAEAAHAASPSLLAA